MKLTMKWGQLSTVAFSEAAFLLWIPTTAFLPVVPSRRTMSFTQAGVVGGGDDYDDWYADFDPSMYEPNNINSYADDDDGNGWVNGSGRQGGRKGGHDRGRTSDGPSGHDYVRDTSRDKSDVDEDTVNQLLSERVAAKKRRDFDTADNIRDQLLNDFSVGVFDKDRTWRTGCSASGSGMQRRNDNRGSPRNKRAPRDFGPQGHDYRQSPDAGPNSSDYTEAEIHDLLAERLQAKLNKDFHLADDIQAQLLSNGVFVHDALKEWRADGISFGDVSRRDGRPGQTAGSRSDRNRPYEKSIYSASPENLDEALITALLEERSKFKQNREFDKADAILAGLRDKYNIYVDDRIREWSVGGNFGEQANTQRQMAETLRQRGYVKSSTSLELSKLDEAYVTAQIQERALAKQNRNFQLADSIRDELEDTLNVVIDDKLKLWSVGGDFSGDGGPRKRGQDKGKYTRRGGGDLTPDEVATISELVQERLEARKSRDFAVADRIRDELREDFNVAIDDKNREWHVDSNEYVEAANSSSGGLRQDEKDDIATRLIERYDCKVAKDYDRADEIRDQLAEEYNVFIDDRTKEWRREGAGDSEAEMDVGAYQTERVPNGEFDGPLADDGDHDAPHHLIENSDRDEEDVTDSLTADVETEERLSALKVAELKERLRQAGLPVSGNKAELIERLLVGENKVGNQ